MTRARSESATPKAKKSAPKKKKPATKDPKGGLTAAGRAAFKASEGADLKPGVKKALKDMTPDEMRRKGSFLRRHYATLRGPAVGRRRQADPPGPPGPRLGRARPQDPRGRRQARRQGDEAPRSVQEGQGEGQGPAKKKEA